MRILWLLLTPILGASALARDDSVTVATRSQPTAAVVGITRLNSRDGQTYVWIPGATFTMGCSPGDNECFDDEKPSHQVSISEGYWIGQTLVTQAAYQQIAGTDPSRFKGEQLPVEW